MKLFKLSILFCLIGTSIGFAQSDFSGERKINDEFKQYWYDGKAELNSYSLKQARYGEIHEGTAVLIFVTEPFSTHAHVKSDIPSKENISVLKLNFEKKFNTGIYPYSMLTSSFVPIEKLSHSLKITSSSQEWCGHTFMQLNNRQDYDIETYSYFEKEGDQRISIAKDFLEDDIWSMIRLNPEDIPTGTYQLIPSFFYLRLKHVNLRSYEAVVEKNPIGSGNTMLKVHYPSLNRVLKIEYESTFPYSIVAWEESYISGWGVSAKMLTTKAKRMKVEKLDYWNKNKIKDLKLRSNMGLGK